MYHATADNFYLVPTAEVPVTNIFRDVILANNEFPVQMTAYTPCFRREAGSYGKDVRGLNRLHQFDKVEIVRVEKPEDSYAALDEMIAHVENIVKSLGLPYRILRLCGGDMSFTSAITYDFEVYSTKNFIKVIQAVKALMKENGWTFQPAKSSMERYDRDTKVYSKTLCFAKPIQTNL